MYVPESDVLQPKNPNLRSSDYWPGFSLTKINVISQQTGEPTSLLSAHKGNPVTVTGRLEEVDDDQLSLIKDPNYRKLIIQLTDVTTYAFAEFEGGGHGFWAAGQAGWFEIEGPLPAYKPIYDEMSVAASMLYFLADKIRKSRKTGFTTSQFNARIKRLFRDYLTIGRFPTRFTDVEDVREGFHAHREFLITSMLEGQEGLNWTDTGMLNYYHLKFPDDVRRIESRIYGTVFSPATAKAINNSQSRAQSPQAKEAQLKRTKGRPRKHSQAPLPKMPASKSTSGDFSSEEDDYGRPNVMTRKRKSILQPSGSKYSKKPKKSIGRRGSLPDFSELSHSDDDEDEGGEKTPSREVSPIITVKNGEHLDLITNPPTSGLLRDTSPPPRFLPRKYLELKVVEYDVPSTEPQGPGDLWTCTYEGCCYRIHRASTTNAQKRIREHFMIHKTQAQEKIDLALNESRPYLPVNNLVRRLQAFAPLVGEGADLESVGREFVAPIRRRY